MTRRRSSRVVHILRRGFALQCLSARMRSEGYSTWFVRLSVCLSVDAYSGNTGYEAAYKLYKRVQIYKGLNINKAILL